MLREAVGYVVGILFLSWSVWRWLRSFRAARSPLGFSRETWALDPVVMLGTGLSALADVYLIWLLARLIIASF